MALDRDVVVVGSGVAGLSAAVAAAETGARVCVLERAPAAEMGGNTRYTEAFLRMKSKDAVADDLEERLLGDFFGHPDPGIVEELGRAAARRSGLVRGHQLIDPDYVSVLAEQAPSTLAWLGTHGVRFDHVPTPFLTTSTTRMAPIGGGLAIVEAMRDAANAKGARFHFDTTARSLVVENGLVVGVAVSRPDGTDVMRGHVVLACGGYQGNSEMMARYHGGRALTARPVARGGNYNKGEGVEMALAVGAATAGNFDLFHAEPVDPRSGAPEAAIFCFPYGILVNTDGQRFVDEARGPVDAWYERVTRIIQAQPDGMAYVILDQRSMDVPNIRAGIRTDRPSIKADTIAELAAALEIPAHHLAHTVDEYNRSCPDEERFHHAAPDGLATTGTEPPKSNWARPLIRGPFEAFPIMAANVFTFGGLKTDAEARVLDRDGRPIPGLWAAGELTGLYYSNYTGSTSVLRGAVFGRIAGQLAGQSA